MLNDIYGQMKKMDSDLNQYNYFKFHQACFVFDVKPNFQFKIYEMF